ncbi:hypothetical protein SAMN06272722_110121 [Paenibacillus sp. RU5A]|nr:hypothetical protein SAMN06272722_110121 [Paenibacillus sp. RU5A]SOC74298.1 hypothetical protein SAMN05880581_110121 [Paenibacillus sp. RU26A]SOC76444.1 hypothetical protein SAMN05880586_110121 [Paenibacillus sp. RU5M]
MTVDALTDVEVTTELYFIRFEIGAKHGSYAGQW